MKFRGITKCYLTNLQALTAILFRDLQGRTLITAQNCSFKFYKPVNFLSFSSHIYSDHFSKLRCDEASWTLDRSIILKTCLSDQKKEF